MKLIALKILFASALVASLSCNSKDGAPSAPGANLDQIIPLAIGNQWVTHIASWDSTGRPNVTGIDTTRIDRDTNLQFGLWFVDNKGNHTTNRATGYWVLSNSIAAMFLKYPTVVDDVYQFGNDSIRVVSVDTPITVPAGTFSCVCYKLTYSSQGVAYQTFFASVNKGIIRREVVAHTTGGQAYLESRADLQSFQLK